MSKFLIITPLYKINGREELFKDTQAIHDLVKFWPNKNNIYVLNAYINGLSKIKRYFNIKQFQYYFSGYNYTCDDINVLLIERQNIFVNQINGIFVNAKRYKKILEKNLAINNFLPDKIIVHLPSTTKFLIKKLDYPSEKIAILHFTDVKFLRRTGKEFIKYLNNNFSRVYCRSRNIYEIFRDAGLNNIQKEIIYSGVEKNNIYYANKNFSNLKQYQILYVGKLIKRKKLDLLLNALSEMNFDWQLNIIGAGPMQKSFEKLSQKLGITANVHFLGKKTKKEVLEYMKKSHIFCMPSINETLGLVYLEAMSQGCITIGTKNEGIDGIIIHNVNGFLTEPTILDLKETINSIINNKKLSKICENAIKTANYYNDKIMSKRYFEIIMGGIENE